MSGEQREFIVRDLCIYRKGKKPPWIDVLMGKIKDESICYCTKRKKYLHGLYTKIDCLFCQEYNPMRSD